MQNVVLVVLKMHYFITVAGGATVYDEMLTEDVGVSVDLIISLPHLSWS